MANAVIIVLLVLIIIFAVKNSLKHFKGEGGCCGGGGDDVKEEIPDKKLEGTKLGEMKVSISGMHCEHCVLSVTKAVNRIPGASAKVNLRKKQAVVSYDRNVSKEEIKSAIEAEGFQVTGIQG